MTTDDYIPDITNAYTIKPNLLADDYDINQYFYIDEFQL